MRNGARYSKLAARIFAMARPCGKRAWCPPMGLHITKRQRDQEQPKMIRYHCWSELLPTIEAALAAHGYYIEVPLLRRDNGAATMVMTHGLASVLLAQRPDDATLEIEIWGTAQSVVAELLESLPIPLHKESSPAIVARDGA
jgi:hypothetical protein